MRILVVEDELKMAALLRRVLERDGFTVDVVGSGEDALASAETITFDTIVLDRMLPGIDGLEVCRRLRANRVLSPILMISACGEAADLAAGLDAGALDYLVKPFPFEALLGRIRAMTAASPSLARRGPAVIR